MADRRTRDGSSLPLVTSPQDLRQQPDESTRESSLERQYVPTRSPPRSPPTTPRRRPAPATASSTVNVNRGNIASPDPNTSASFARKPSILRRTSSTRPPQRGSIFSADDTQEEIEPESWRPARYASGATRQPSTVRRRPAAASRLPTALETRESEETVTDEQELELSRHPTREERIHAEHQEREEEEEEEADEEEGEEEEEEDTDDTKADAEDDDDDLSDAESFTLKDRQEAINETHPFGIRVWKPALYKKSRSVEKGAEVDIHSAPGQHVKSWLWIANIFWTLIFGWWLAAIAILGGLVCHVFAFAPGSKEYGRVLLSFGGYIFYPFGKYVKLIQEDAYLDEDEGAGRTIADYEQWQSGDIEEGRLFFGPIKSLVGRRRSEVDSEDGERDPLLRRGQRNGGIDDDDVQQSKSKRRLFGRGEWNTGRIIYFAFFYGLLTPSLLLVSLICWLIILAVPMARASWLLLYHLRRRPLALEFHSDSTQSNGAGAAPSAIILCTYRAVGLKYWKYTVGGTNIILINLLSVVAFVIFDYFVLYEALGLEIWLTNTIFVFLLALFSIIPLAYFIGQAVASISAQSTMGVGAAINAFFSTIVEVFLYCVALRQGKSKLVEGSIIGSVFAGILLLPGLSMCFGAVKRKTQRFNVKSAGVTTTMLLFAVIGAFGPTLFYQIYGAHELNCDDCVDRHGDPLERDCKRCFFAQIPAVNDPFYTQIVRPYCWLAAVALFLSYIVGLLFTLRTHAATIWNIELDEKKAEKAENTAVRSGKSIVKLPSIDYGTTPTTSQMSGSFPKPSDIRESRMYKKILGQSLKDAGIQSPALTRKKTAGGSKPSSVYGRGDDTSIGNTTATTDYGVINDQQTPNLQIEGLTAAGSRAIIRQMAEMAATAAAVAARDAQQGPPRKQSYAASSKHVDGGHPTGQPILSRIETNPQTPANDATANVAVGADTSAPASGGHDAPNWSRNKSFVVLLSATVAYAIIAEILVDTVDAVLSNVNIDQKFLGITLFALVPNTTEFLNAISFAMNGNIALSMEIGSAYALQVCLLQIPALVLFSAMSLGLDWQNLSPRQIENHAFTLIFPQWDMVTTILCVFLLAYMYGEGKSNYFKGGILILSYLVVLIGFYLSGFSSLDLMDPNEDGPWTRTNATVRKTGYGNVIVFG